MFRKRGMWITWWPPYPLHGLNNAMQVEAGDVIELGEHSLEMIDAMFVDHGFSQWAIERKTGMFISIDWGHNLHDAARGQCFMFLDEMMTDTDYNEDVYLNDVKVNYWYQFPWLAFTDADEIAAAVEQIFAQHDIKILDSSPQPRQHHPQRRRPLRATFTRSHAPSGRHPV